MSERPPVDDELEGIFDRPSDVAFAQRLHEGPRPMVEADPAFREALRRRLMQEAWKRKERRRPWHRRLLGPAGLAWAGAMAGVLLIVFATVTLSQNTGGSTQKVFTSPINGHTQVATTSAIVVNFPQPMNPAATEQAAKISPATEASYHWTDNNQTLTIVPKNDGLAPGVEYQVTFTAEARTESNQPLTPSTTSPAPITFVTQQPPQPTPAPTPSSTASPSPAPAPSPLSGVRELGSSDGSQPVWSLDGTQIYVIGQGGTLTAYPARGGAGTAIAQSGVSQVVAGPAGPAYLAGTTVSYGDTTTNVPGVTSIGFQSTARGLQLMAVAGTAVSRLGTGVASFTLQAAPTAAAAFSPSGNEMVYLAANGLHLVDLVTNTESTVGAATTLGAWAPAGDEYAYIDQGGLSILNAASGSTTGVSGLPGGVSAVSWTNNGLLISTAAGIQELTSPTASASTLTGAAAAAASWSPASVLLTYVQAGDAYVAMVDSSSVMAAISNVLTQFMAARQSGSVSEAQSLLTPSAQATFNAGSGLYLTTYGTEALNRWSVILAQPSGLAVVRTVFSQGTQQSVFDEQFQIARAGQQYLIEQAVGTPVQTGVSGGPAIQTIQVGPASISVRFDSDLNPVTVPAGLVVQESSGAPVAPQSATYNATTRTVLISLPTLSAGVQYQLQILSGLKDVNGQSATRVQIAFTSPATQPGAVSSPAPSATPSPSPVTTPSPAAAPTPSPSPTQ